MPRKGSPRAMASRRARTQIVFVERADEGGVMANAGKNIALALQRLIRAAARIRFDATPRRCSARSTDGTFPAP